MALPETEDEAFGIASLFGNMEHHSTFTADYPTKAAVVYTDRGACEDQVKQLLGAANGEGTGWRYILFSTHGLADPQNGMLSCIELSTPDVDSEEDGLLQAQEVLSPRLDTELVMLSACQTGLGKLYRGEGLVGLSTAFFYAGAESICASLWSVPSIATKCLVTEFFKQMIGIPEP